VHRSQAPGGIRRRDYFVSWEIEIEADNPIEAALKAREAQTRIGTRSTVFNVYGDDASDPIRVDLTAIEEGERG
jgi:hypothetical protein